jgi:hypothetical protein
MGTAAGGQGSARGEAVWYLATTSSGLTFMRFFCAACLLIAVHSCLCRLSGYDLGPKLTILSLHDAGAGASNLWPRSGTFAPKNVGRVSATFVRLEDLDVTELGCRCHSPCCVGVRVVLRLARLSEHVKSFL